MSLHQISLRPSDILFFRDGRPMSGSLAGHTAAWPMPDVTSHALHAALHRAGLEDVHQHRRGRSGTVTETRDRKFGSLVTAGPFPVDPEGRWFFPRPADAEQAGSVQITHLPEATPQGSPAWRECSSLPAPLTYAVTRITPPSKDAGGERWLSKDGFNAYLTQPPETQAKKHFLSDTDLASREHAIGIGIDPERQTQDGKSFYSAHYLRLAEGYQLGVIASAEDKGAGNGHPHRDLIAELLRADPARILVGGQQRLCTASRIQPDAGTLPLPRGLDPSRFETLADGRIAVKWVLLTPALWPRILPTKKGIREHAGGWLPNWIDPDNGQVLLRASDPSSTRPANMPREAWRQRIRSGEPLGARLVAARIPKPIPVTGWALPSESDPERTQGGAKPTHLAVPAGAVYYFAADNREQATRLAALLNWHAASAEGTPTTITHRRSTLLGEKGYGLGVCGTWSIHFLPPR